MTSVYRPYPLYDLYHSTTFNTLDRVYIACCASKEEKRHLQELNQKFSSLFTQVDELTDQVPHASILSLIRCGAPVSMVKGVPRPPRPSSCLVLAFSRYIAPWIALCTGGSCCSKNLGVFVQKSHELKLLKESIKSIETAYKNRAILFTKELMQQTVLFTVAIVTGSLISPATSSMSTTKRLCWSFVGGASIGIAKAVLDRMTKPTSKI